MTNIKIDSDLISQIDTIIQEKEKTLVWSQMSREEFITLCIQKYIDNFVNPIIHYKGKS